MATALEQLCGLTAVTGVEKALRCQQAEHTFCDTPCGIMDQFISSMGEKGQLLLIDCRSQTHTLIPFGTGADSPVVLVTNSNVKHQLSGSEYPDRVRQCKEAVAAIKVRGFTDQLHSSKMQRCVVVIGGMMRWWQLHSTPLYAVTLASLHNLRFYSHPDLCSTTPILPPSHSLPTHTPLTPTHRPPHSHSHSHPTPTPLTPTHRPPSPTPQTKYKDVKALRDCTMDMLNATVPNKQGDVYKRARHGITEDARTLGAVKALSEEDFAAVGRLMTASHASLRDDYDVSCAELDVLVGAALEVTGVYGSRMTGGGFGGCTVTLVERKSVDQLVAHLKKTYQERCNKGCDCYVGEPAEGSGVIDMGACLRRKQWQEWFDWLVPGLVTVAAVGAVVAMRGLARRK